uniref:CBF domain-containing protein n=1 Tax=Macrostomum lignano TaxID=282301 RepID=A0A1I8FN46_9PLAT
NDKAIKTHKATETDKDYRNRPKLTKTKTVNSTSADWHRDNALPIVACLAELGAPLSARERDSLVRKSICCLRRVDISNLAGLLYHAFLFASKAGLLRLVICEVVEFFAELEGSNEKENSQGEPDGIHAADANEEDIVEAEGTVLVHLLYTIRLSPTLSAELLKVLRSLPLAQLLRPFSLALYFVLVSARMDDDMHRPLRLIVARYYQERCLRSESVFLRSFPDPLSDASAAGAADADSEGSGSSSSVISDPIVSAFDIVATRAARQWDNIVPGLVGFAFSCLEGTAAAAAAKQQSYQTSAGIAAARAVNRLGRELLVRMYRRAEAARETILSEAVALLLTTGGSRPLANLIRTLIARYPTLALKQHEMLRANLDSLLATLPESVAVATVASLAPLLRWSSRLRDSLIMCLRKVFVRPSGRHQTDGVALFAAAVEALQAERLRRPLLSLRRPRRLSGPELRFACPLRSLASRVHRRAPRRAPPRCNNSSGM